MDVQTLELAYDWTFTTQYAGSLSSASPVPSSDCPSPIPLSLLSRPDPILYFCSLTLYEDELHDNGVASCSLKLRVMERCWLCLLTFWLRVDDVCLRLSETRTYCQDMAGQQAAVIREHTEREESFASLIAVRRSGVSRPLTSQAAAPSHAAVPSCLPLLRLCLCLAVARDAQGGEQLHRSDLPREEAADSQADERTTGAARLAALVQD